ncbi:MAG: hypothetical protein ACR2PS_06690, partial [Pseudomonadales bacterium]
MNSVLARNGITPNKIRRHFTRPEQSLKREKKQAELRAGRKMADLNLYYEIAVPGNVNIAELLDALNALDIVELAQPMPLPPQPPVDLAPPTGDFTNLQGYRDAAPDGIGVADNQAIAGIDGSGIAFVDIEYSWLLDHEDLELPSTANIDTEATGVDPFPATGANHGTAVLGEIVGGDNAYGVTGLATGAAAFVAPANTAEFGYNPARAINIAAGALSPGDVILLEQQFP